MSATPFTDMLDQIIRRALHDRFMDVSMSMNEALKGAPYGPTLNEVFPSKLRGILAVTGE